MLLGGPPGVADPVGKRKRVRQLPNDGEFRESGEGWSRVEAWARILLAIDQRGFLGRRSKGTKKQQHRYETGGYPCETQIPKGLTHSSSPFHGVGSDCQDWNSGPAVGVE